MGPELSFRTYVIALVIGLFVTFGVGFVVGIGVGIDVNSKTTTPQVLSPGPFPLNYDIAKHDQEVLQGCYKLLSDSVITLRQDQLALTESVRKTCDPKPVAH